MLGFIRHSRSREAVRAPPRWLCNCETIPNLASGTRMNCDQWENQSTIPHLPGCLHAQTTVGGPTDWGWGWYFFWALGSVLNRWFATYERGNRRPKWGQHFRCRGSKLWFEQPSISGWSWKWKFPSTASDWHRRCWNLPSSSSVRRYEYRWKTGCVCSLHWF